MAINGINNYYSAYTSLMQRTNYGSRSSRYNTSPIARIMATPRLYSNEAPQASILDYKMAQQIAREQYNRQQENKAEIDVMKKDSAAYLKQYIEGNENLADSAKNLRGENLDKLLYDKEGNVTDETLKNVSEAMQNMVKSYNDSLDTLSQNKDRGVGTARQLAQMQRAPAASFSMQMVGLSKGENGKLSLDSDKLVASLKEASGKSGKAGGVQLDLLKDVIGGTYGVASKIAKTAEQGNQQTTNAVISNDLVKIKNKTIQNNMNTYNINSLSGGLYNRKGTMSALNFNMAGMLMNLMA